MADVEERRETTTIKSTGDSAPNIAARIIWFIASVILVLLAFRFVFSLLGANRNNAVADFVYSVTYPLVAPFFTLFNYNPTYNGISKFETYTLVAMVVYLFIAWGLATLVTIASRRDAV